MITEGTQMLKNLTKPLVFTITISLFNNFIINKFIKLVEIDRGNKMYKISTRLKSIINKNGVPSTKTPTPTQDWIAIIKHK